MRRGAVLLAALALAATRTARAQDSVFGIRGLGFLDRSVSGKSAAMGGGLALFDPEAALNPASISGWHVTAGWAVAAGSNRSFDAGAGSSSFSATRFPVIGFAGALGAKASVAVTVSDYLDRNWSVVQTDTVAPRGTPVVATDNTKSAGGVTDIRVAMAYRLTGLTLGVGLHALTGSTTASVIRQFLSDSTYLPFNQEQVTTYSGVGISFGALVTPTPKLLAGASVRINGRMKASASDTSASVAMPLELNGGLYYQPIGGVTLTTTVGYAGWATAADALAAAGQARSRNVWSVGAGLEVVTLHVGRSPVPLRLGYRWRELPFPIPTTASAAAPLSEHAVTGGLGFDTAGGRATVDVGIESGARVAGALKETFTAAYLGLTIRP